MSLFPENGAAFVAGGSGGIGSAVCRALAAAGSDVVLTYRSNRDKAEAVVAQVAAMGRRAWALPVALEDETSVEAAVAEAVEKAGGLHSCIYASGPFVDFAFVSKMTPADMRRYLLTDTMAAFNLTHYALPHLRKGGGSVVAITTTAAERWANQDGYSAIPKSAVNSLMKGIAREEGRFGIRANMVALGIIEAGMFHQTVEKGLIDDRYLAAMAKNCPLGRTGTAEEVAEAVLFLASSKASYTTGTTIFVDGGFTV